LNNMFKNNRVSQIHGIIETYKGFTARRVYFGVVLYILIIICSIWALNTGSYSIPPAQIVEALINRNNRAGLVIWNIRLPRIASAVVVGAGLAVSGTVMQCLLKNPLASPFTMGISHGAMFGASFAIGILGAGTTRNTEGIFISNPYIVVIFAFGGSLLGMVAILTLSRLRGLSPGAMVLAGVAMGSLFTAATTLVQYFAAEQELASMVYWSFGNLGRAVWKEIFIITVVFVPCFTYFFFKRWDYNALVSGDETARTLGVNTERIRLSGALLASLVTAVSVALVGIIGFIGLISPHVIRLLIGGDHRFLVPISALFGGLLLLVSDTLARVVIAPVLLPVGVLTSFMGAPMFIYLLIKTRGKI